jgi:transposase
MFFAPGRVRVFLYGQPCDMRRSYDGLYALARSSFAGFGCEPTSGHLFVFMNRRGTQMKVLYFERGGWCVWAKRLEAGQFVSGWAEPSKSIQREMDCTALMLLIEGIELGRQRKRYRHPGSSQIDAQLGSFL